MSKSSLTGLDYSVAQPANHYFNSISQSHYTKLLSRKNRMFDYILLQTTES